ncbi:MAG: hypothetical protein K8S20_08375 [Chloroflexi bacterium]|nr:hypothetical protein [Chloroflexota bacterium]
MKKKMLEVLTVTFYIFTTLLVILTGVGVLIILNVSGIGWTWEIAGALVGVALFYSASRTKWGRNLIPLLKFFLPFIDYLITRARKQAECEEIVNNMELALKRYRLFDRLQSGYAIRINHASKLSPQCRDGLKREIMGVTGGKDAICSCSETIARCMAQSMDYRIPAILYYEYFHKFDIEHLSAKKLYNDIKNDSGMLRELAAILFRSGLLRDPDDFEITNSKILAGDSTTSVLVATPKNLFPHQAEDLLPFLSDMDEYELEELKERVRKFRGLLKVARGYLTFLKVNGVFSKRYRVNAYKMLRVIKRNLGTVLQSGHLLNVLDNTETIVPAILNWQGKRLIGAHLSNGQSKDRQLIDGLSLISQIIFLSINHKEMEAIKSRACREAADNCTAVDLNLAYLLLRAKPQKIPGGDGQGFVSIEDIARDWESEIRTRIKKSEKGYQKETLAIRENLQEGSWINRIHLLREFINQNMISQNREGIHKLKEIIRRNPGTDTVLKSLFLNLKLETIERFLEARTVTAYIITFDSEKGSMARLIDSFVSSDGQAALQKAGIINEYKGRPKYVFKEYIKQCRLGIVPKGMPFDKFYQSFERDLKKLYKYQLRGSGTSKNQLGKFEVIIHRFGLSGRDRHGFDKFNTEATKRHALPKFRLLLAETLDVEDMLAIMGYEKTNIDEKENFAAILEDVKGQAAILDFVEPAIRGLTKKQKNSLRDNDQKIKERLLFQSGFRTSKELEQAMEEGRVRKLAEETLSGILEELPPFDKDPGLCRKISSLYLGNLHDLSCLGQIRNLPIHRNVPAPVLASAT